MIAHVTGRHASGFRAHAPKFCAGMAGCIGLRLYRCRCGSARGLLEHGGAWASVFLPMEENRRASSALPSSRRESGRLLVVAFKGVISAARPCRHPCSRMMHAVQSAHRIQTVSWSSVPIGDNAGFISVTVDHFRQRSLNTLERTRWPCQCMQLVFSYCFLEVIRIRCRHIVRHSSQDAYRPFIQNIGSFRRIFYIRFIRIHSFFLVCQKIRSTQL
jgi:hypothetical protein